jgi:hypothetical protein
MYVELASKTALTPSASSFLRSSAKLFLTLPIRFES